MGNGWETNEDRKGLALELPPFCSVGHQSEVEAHWRELDMGCQSLPQWNWIDLETLQDEVEFIGEVSKENGTLEHDVSPFCSWASPDQYVFHIFPLCILSAPWLVELNWFSYSRTLHYFNQVCFKQE